MRSGLLRGALALPAAFILAGAVPAAAEDVSATADGAQPRTQCQVTDPRLPELSERRGENL